MGTLLTRSAGCAFNDWADRKFDAHVKRTAQRPLAAGEIPPWEALAVAAALFACAFVLVLATNEKTILLSLPAIAITLLYPFTKRFFALPQAVLGIAFSFGIPMAYSAVWEAVAPLGWWLLGLNALWVMAYDTEYAMVDRDDDARLGVRSSALTLGRWDVAAVVASYGATAAMLFALGPLLSLAGWYYAGVAVAAGLAAWHWWLIRDRSREGCWRAFMHSNWTGAAVFAGIVLSFPLRLSMP
jgi:4-hydroxybenzoate polyprenyltransferase